MMKKLPILLITICACGVFAFFAPKAAFASTAFSISGNTNAITVSANSTTPQTTYEVTIDANGPVTFNTSSISFNGSVCATGYPHSFVYSPGSSSSASAPITVFCSTQSQTTTTGGTLFTIPVSTNSQQESLLNIDTSSSNTKAADVGVADSISSYGGTLTLNPGAATPTPTPTPTPSQTTTPSTTTSATPTAGKTTGTPTPTSLKATPLTVSPPGGFAAHPTTNPTVTTANQPSLVVVTQPPYKVVPTPTQTAGLQQVVVTPSITSIQTLVQGYFNNTAAAALFVVPILTLLLMVGFLSIRMFQMNRRRQREIELLFEHELGELAALESKMDIINEKGGKGKDEFKEEFQRTKDQILKEIRPDYIGNQDQKPPEKSA